MGWVRPEQPEMCLIIRIGTNKQKINHVNLGLDPFRTTGEPLSGHEVRPPRWTGVTNLGLKRLAAEKVIDPERASDDRAIRPEVGRSSVQSTASPLQTAVQGAPCISVEGGVRWQVASGGNDS